MEFQIIWFVLWSVLWAVYFMLDGFDFGAGILQTIIGKTDTEKRMIINSIGPVWDGNEVWLITAGGATFAAFPTTYALMFSYLYSAMLLILFALILRGVAFEFRSKKNSSAWKKGWDRVIFLSSLSLALLFGVAFGNIFKGLPMDASGYHGSLLYLLNSYGVFTGMFFVLLFAEHGALRLSIKTEGEPRERAQGISRMLWPLLVLITAGFLIYTKFATNLYVNYFQHPVWSIVPVLAVLSLAGIRLFLSWKDYSKAFYASCVLIVTVVFTGVIGLYPSLIPSDIDPNYSLTIFNSSSSIYTLKIMTVVALIFMPLVILYQIWIYRIFKQGVSAGDLDKDNDAY